VDISNTIYVSELGMNRAQVWLEGNVFPTRNISGNLNGSYGIFATVNGDIYIDNGLNNHRVDKWTVNATNSVAVMNVPGMCQSLFVDVSDNLYCSLGTSNQVVKQSLNNNTNTTTIVAGNGTAGNASNMLAGPRGIFVDSAFNLYVADILNQRIQLFRVGQLNATTVAGNGANGTITLNDPIGVVLDADGYLYILNWGNGRIVRSGPNGFQCLLACSNTTGPASYQLSSPTSLSFDSYGNLFVVDRSNNRIQKFLLATNSCGKYFNFTEENRTMLCL
jgi:hypothetical protein